MDDADACEHASKRSFRIEWARLVAEAHRSIRCRSDLGTAEELAQDALVAALETWPVDGVPREPGAWLMQVAKNRALTRIDRQKRWDREVPKLRDHACHGRSAGTRSGCDRGGGRRRCRRRSPSARLRVLPSVARCGEPCRAHASRPPGGPHDGRDRARVRRAGGDDRAAHRAREARRSPNRAPRSRCRAAQRGSPRGSRSVLEVVYFVFNEGYAATARRRLDAPADLCEDALRLGRILAELDAELRRRCTASSR